MTTPTITATIASANHTTTTDDYCTARSLCHGGHIELTIRPAAAADRPLIRRATIDNLNWMELRFTPEEVDADPRLAHYYAAWPGPDDLGFVAGEAGHPIGAVWLAFRTAADPGYGYTSDDVPELSIWVRDGHRGRGIGTELMAVVIAEARGRRLPAISLSVEDGNPARRLYERCGFVEVPGAAAGTLRLDL